MSLALQLEALNDMTNLIINPVTDALFNFRFEYSAVLLVLIPLLFILLFLIRKDFVKLDKIYVNKSQLKARTSMKIWIFFSRLIIFALLLAALAVPFGEIERDSPGEPKLTILVDNSTSMELFDISFVEGLKQAVDKRIPTTIKNIGSGMNSRIGDGVLGSLEKNGNVLLVSDGQVTEGTALTDIALFASSLNATINAIDLSEVRNDAGISIIGPSKTTADTETMYRARIWRAGDVGKVKVKITIDDSVVLEQETIEDELQFSKTFQSGYHEIEASIIGLKQDEDHFSENNVFRKTTHVIKKPKILFVTSEDNVVSSILDELYEVEQLDYIPDSKSQLDEYYAVVLNDLPEKYIGSISALKEYVIEGNGLFVIGGYNSYDNGNYKDRPIEALLPVTVGSAGPKPGGANIVLVIDISGSTGAEFGSGSAVDVEKSLALSVISDISEKNKVGAIAFNDQAYLVSDIEPLFVNKAELQNKISRLIDGGPTTLYAGMSGAYELLKGRSGSRNIVFISDGFTLDTVDLQTTKVLVSQMYSQGVQTFVIGVGKRTNKPYLQTMAALGGGFFLEATERDKLKIVFGEPEKKDVGVAFDLFLLNRNHFITQSLELDAVLYGYNQVIPKTSTQLLVTTDSGEPAVTVWRYGIGRVAALTVFSSGNNLGELLNRKNSILLTRIVNWVIADPERKEDYFISVEDARLNERSEVIVRSDRIPTAEGLEFRKIKEDDIDTYSAFLLNEELGFHDLLGAEYAVNNDKEYEKIGINPDLGSIVRSTGGKLFKPEETDAIIQHTITASRRTVLEKTRFQAPLIIAALIIFLLEIITRRIFQTWFRS